MKYVGSIPLFVVYHAGEREKKREIEAGDIATTHIHKYRVFAVKMSTSSRIFFLFANCRNEHGSWVFCSLLANGNGNILEG